MDEKEKTPSNKKLWIKNIIAQKAWYSFNPKTNSFNWSESLEKLSDSFGIPKNDLGQIFEKSFDPSCLITAEVSQTGDKKRIPLIEAVFNMGISLHIWTVGDESWQRKKYEKVGAYRWITNDNYHCAALNKEEELKRIILSMNTAGKKIIVVDDKEENIERIKKLAIELKPLGILIFDYHFKKNDPQADGTAFIKWLTTNFSGELSLEIFLDFDGVVADTDSVLFNQAVDGIYEYLNQEKKN